MNVPNRGKSCMLLESLIIINFVSAAFKLVESTLQTTGIDTFTVPLLVALSKAESVTLKRFYQNKTFLKSYPETSYAKLTKSSAILVYTLL